MMAVDVKRLNDGSVKIDTSRAERAGDVQREKNRVRAELLRRAIDEPERKWFALTVAPNSENAVENSVLKAGFEAWAPCKKVEAARRVARYKAPRIVKEVPAFPGYVFVFVAPIAETWSWLRGVDFVSGAVCGMGGPCPIGIKEINKVKGLIDKGWLDQTVDAKRRRKAELAIEPGDHVVIEDGPLALMRGVLEGYIGSRHVRVLTWLFGREALVTLDLAQIAKSE
jgi:transcription antitermination factor NusG